jgi:hypothetical protein
MRRRAGREGQGPFIHLPRFLEPSYFRQSGRQVRMRRAVIGTELDGLAIRRDRLLMPPRPRQRHAEVAVIIGHVPIDGHRAGQRLNRVVPIAQVQRDQTIQMQRCIIPRLRLDRPSQQPLGLLQPAQGELLARLIEEFAR